MAQWQDPSVFHIGKMHEIKSKILDENRKIYVHVPDGFWGLDTQMESYPIAIVLDGESQFLQTLTNTDDLSAAPLGNDLMPRTIIVGIPNTDRLRDFTPYPAQMGLDTSSISITGGSPDFLEFITSEVIPFVESLYPTNAHRTLIGHSLGGLAVFHALIHHAHSFDQYLAIDPYLAYDNGTYLNMIIDSLNRHSYSEEKLYIAAATQVPSFLTLNHIDRDTSEVTAIVRSNRKFETYLNSTTERSHIAYVSFAGENHFSIPTIATIAGFRWFYQDFPFPEIMDYYHPQYQRRTDLVPRLHEHYSGLSNALGYDIAPMESYLNSFAHGLDHFRRSDLAMQLLDYSIQIYPNRPSTYKSKGQYLASKNRNAEAIQAFEKSLAIAEDPDLTKLVAELRTKIKQ